MAMCGSHLLDEHDKEWKAFHKTLDSFPHSFQLEGQDQQFTDRDCKRMLNTLQADLNAGLATPLEVARSRNLLAYVHFLLGDPRKAFQEVENALTEHGEERNIVSLANQACLLWHRGEYSKARELVAHLNDMKNDDDDFAYLVVKAKGELAFSYTIVGGQFGSKAVPLFKAVLTQAREPESWLWKFGLALEKRRLVHMLSAPVFSDETEDARLMGVLHTFMEVIEICKNTNLKAKCYAEIAQLLQEKQRTSSQKTFENVAMLTPLEACQKALELDSNDPSVLWKCGKIFRYHRRLDQSVEVLERSLDLRPTTTVFHHLGLAYKDKAIQAKKTARRFDFTGKRGGRGAPRNSRASHRGCPEYDCSDQVFTTELLQEHASSVRGTGGVVGWREQTGTSFNNFSQARRNSSRRGWNKSGRGSRGLGSMNMAGLLTNEVYGEEQMIGGYHYSYGEQMTISCHGDIYRGQLMSGRGDSYGGQMMSGCGDTYGGQMMSGHGDTYRGQMMSGHGDTYGGQMRSSHGYTYGGQMMSGHCDTYGRQLMSGHGEAFGGQMSGCGGIYERQLMSGHGYAYSGQMVSDHGGTYRRQMMRCHGDTDRQHMMGCQANAHRGHMMSGHGYAYREQMMSGHGDTCRGQVMSGHGNKVGTKRQGQRGGQFACSSRNLHAPQDARGSAGSVEDRLLKQFTSLSLNSSHVKTSTSDLSHQRVASARYVQNSRRLATPENQPVGRKPHNVASEQEIASLRSVVKSPMKMPKLSRSDEFVEWAMTAFQKAIEISHENNIRALYDLALMHRAIGELDEALRILDIIILCKQKSVGPFDKINAYEQAGLILRDKSAVEGDEDLKKKFSEEGEAKLHMALRMCSRLCSRLPRLQHFIPHVWHSFHTLSKTAEKPEKKDTVKLLEKARLFQYIKEHHQSLALLQDIKRFTPEEAESPDHLKMFIENYVELEQYDEALSSIELLKCTEQSSALSLCEDDQYVQKVYLKAAKAVLLGATSADAFDKAGCHFLSAFRDTLSNSSEDSSSSDDAESTEGHVEDSDIWDVMLLHDETEADKAKDVAGVLDTVCGLEVTCMAKDCLPGRPFLESVLSVIKKSRQVVVLAGRPSASYTSDFALLMEKAAKRPTTVALLVEGEHVPKAFRSTSVYRRFQGRHMVYPQQLLTWSGIPHDGTPITGSTVDAICGVFAFLIDIDMSL